MADTAAVDANDRVRHRHRSSLPRSVGQHFGSALVLLPPAELAALMRGRQARPTRRRPCQSTGRSRLPAGSWSATEDGPGARGMQASSYPPGRRAGAAGRPRPVRRRGESRIPTSTRSGVRTPRPLLLTIREWQSNPPPAASAPHPEHGCIHLLARLTIRAWRQDPPTHLRNPSGIRRLASCPSVIRSRLRLKPFRAAQVCLDPLSRHIRSGQANRSAAQPYRSPRTRRTRSVSMYSVISPMRPSSNRQT
jgi:hypothetical protein